MPNIQIKDVPADVHGVLRARAARSRQSLQEYLLTHLVQMAARPTLDEVLDRAEPRPGGASATAIVASVRADRDGR